ncbi:hypothetical protein [Streptomyces sp. MMG1121]|uniref:hypothetical protein n=1 Tax=Streptomyces sp. MMG1121 TaxID=1415544 RepID=UPI0006ADAE93|nr:hypothetical protein [Streptomyces sp. MMG1121]
MTVAWAFAGDDAVVPLEEAVAGLRRRITALRPESWFTSSAGRLLSVPANTERALVMLLDGDADPGGYAVAGAGAEAGGFRLANGQCDMYPDEGTVPLDEAFRSVGS